MVRRTAFLSLAAAGALAVAGCGLGGAPQTGAVDTSGQVTGAITFQTLQLSPTFDKYLHGVIAGFEKKYPGTKVTWNDIPSNSAARKTNADAVAKSLPDVMDLDTRTLAPLARKGLVVDMATSAGDLKAGFVPSAWKSLTFGSTVEAALPWYLNTPVLLKNSALLEQAGLTSAPDPASYTELVEASTKVAQATGKAGFQPTEIGFPNYLLSLGVPLVNDQGTEAVVNTPAAVAFVDSLAELQKSGGIPADSVAAQQRSEIETFQEGGTAYLETGGSRLKIIQQNAPAVYSKITLGKPLGVTGPGTWLVPHGIAVPKTSANLPTAVAFAKFLTSSENQLALAKQSSVFPSTTAALDDPFFTGDGTGLVSKARTISAASLKNGTTVVLPAAVDSEFSTALWSAVQPAIIGEVPAAQALADAQTKLTTILKAR
ncbi:extracellular solute-binding protein [Amycolatopsis mongoliensis]|uniref:Extracellular solute-binding protein n=1 Tax=Amycolatopsis mongoliensis TaxID=715475 RepID=A0A9Y2JPD2_9PSEU|nr:extracellular solute-binding protein [Amycolatopsis sp. 4-36]WIY00957.1 extracellular solute-binding protein [Amycolatopsis sp. 4-36]